MSENVSLVFSFVSASFFPCGELLGAGAEVALQLFQAGALALHGDQRFLRLRLLGHEGRDLVLRRRDALFQMLSHPLCRVSELLAN
jgi:hypothetical protein